MLDRQPADEMAAARKLLEMAWLSDQIVDGL